MPGKFGWTWIWCANVRKFTVYQLLRIATYQKKFYSQKNPFILLLNQFEPYRIICKEIVSKRNKKIKIMAYYLDSNNWDRLCSQGCSH